MTLIATIHVQRVSNRWVDRLRAYRILVDGQERGKVSRGESLELAVEPGAHVVQARIDWCRSPILEVNLTAGERADIECRPNANGLTALWYATVGFGRYIVLRQITEPVRAQN